MILFNPNMKTERIAVIGFAILIVAALSFFILSQENPETGKTYLEEIVENVFGQSTAITIEEGDCADVNYVGRFYVNDTVFDTSYEEIAKQAGLYTEGWPYESLKIFVETTGALSSPGGYSDYYSTMISGFINGLIGISEGETKEITIPPEEAYGVWSETLPGYSEKPSQPIDIEYEYDWTENKTTFVSYFPDVNLSVNEAFDYSSQAFDVAGIINGTITDVTDENINYTLEPVNGSEFIMPVFGCNSTIITSNNSENFTVHFDFEIGHELSMQTFFGAYHLKVLDINETDVIFAINMEAPLLQFVNQTLIFEVTVEKVYKTSLELES